VTISTFRSGHYLPRSLRDATALLVLTMYLIAGVLHGVCDLDVAHSPSRIAVSLADDSTGHSDRGALADHHCHGCFSISVPAPVVVAVAMMPTVEVRPALQAAHRGLAPGLDPPPPKGLT
jgi:hypothetical protein